MTATTLTRREKDIEHNNGSEPTLKIVKVFGCPLQTLYEAWLRPERLERWMGAEDERIENISVDAVEGGLYHMEFVMPDGSREMLNGEYLKIDPCDTLEFSWAWDRSDDIPVARTIVSLAFKPVKSGTELTLMHTHFRDQRQRDMHRSGWDQSFGKLERYICR